MKKIMYIGIFLLFTLTGFAQQKETDKIKKQSDAYTYKANKALGEDSFAIAETEYRKAISKDGENTKAKYNLGNAYYENESYKEAFNRYKEASEVASTKAEKHSAYHNMGNVFMKNKEYKKAIEAYKNALRNNPKDDETRYNLALAKDMLEKKIPQKLQTTKKKKTRKKKITKKTIIRIRKTRIKKEKMRRIKEAKAIKKTKRIKTTKNKSPINPIKEKVKKRSNNNQISYLLNK